MARSPRTRPIVGLILTLICVVALVGAAVVKWAVAPRLVKIPDSGTSTTISEGDGQALDTTTGKLMPDPGPGDAHRGRAAEGIDIETSRSSRRRRAPTCSRRAPPRPTSKDACRSLTRRSSP